MKKQNLLAIVPSILIALSFACNQTRPMPVGTTAAGASAQAAATDAEIDASNDLYVADMIDGEMETGMDGMEMPKDPADQTVPTDMKQTHLQKMAADLLEELDADNNKILTEAEFLSVLDKKEGLTDKQKMDLSDKLKVSFAMVAGEDKMLSEMELQAFLKSKSEKVEKVRCKKHKGQHPERVKQSFEDILKKFDKDGDGKLSKEEFEAMQGDKKQCHKKNNNGKGQGKGDGKGMTPAPAPTPGGPVIVIPPATPAMDPVKGMTPAPVPAVDPVPAPAPAPATDNPSQSTKLKH